jgi:hypothetical protein
MQIEVVLNCSLNRFFLICIFYQGISPAGSAPPNAISSEQVIRHHCYKRRCGKEGTGTAPFFIIAVFTSSLKKMEFYESKKNNTVRITANQFEVYDGYKYFTR